MRPDADDDTLPSNSAMFSKLNRRLKEEENEEEEDILNSFDYNYYTFMPASELNGKTINLTLSESKPLSSKTT